MIQTSQQSQAAENLAAALERIMAQHAANYANVRPELMRDADVRKEYFGGISRSMGMEWEADARYCAERGGWIFWRCDRWEFDRTKLHLTRTRAWMRAKAAAIVAARPSMAKKAAALRDDAMIYAINRLVTSNAELACTLDDWDVDSMLLGGRRPSICGPARPVPRAPWTSC